MTLDQYNFLCTPSELNNSLITIEDLVDKSERDTFIIEIIEREIRKYIIKYGYDTNYIKTLIPITTNEDYIPNKKIYPERCDYEFCLLLVKRFISSIHYIY